MKLTKDEARILADCLFEQKYTIINEHSTIPGLYNKLVALENRLAEFCDDKRRKGRTSQDDFYDMLKRFVNK